jgi:hypothetical protein
MTVWESPIRRAKRLRTFAALIDSGGIMRARAIKLGSWSIGPMAAIVMLLTNPVADAGAEDRAIEPIRSTSETTQWLMAENLKAGTAAWRIPRGTRQGIQGYADHVSAERGDRVSLYVQTEAPSFRVTAYRMGWYQGFGARQIWSSNEIDATRQPRPSLDSRTNTVRARWSPSLRFRVGDGWVQGDYLLKLVTDRDGESYVPLTIRDDASHAALVIQNEVTTWQAYNAWGGYSLYHGPSGSFRSRSRVVTFDRPYKGNGAAGFLSNEYPMVELVERMGLDVTYWTDVDFHERPQLLMNHHALISLQHDEYWSSSMRDGALHARAHGVNIAFFGADADYRHIRFASTRLGKARDEICYKVAREDPLYGENDREVTSNWRAEPVPRPESLLNGGLYQCNPVHADMVVSEAKAWIFRGTGLHNGDHLPGLVSKEYDRVDPKAPTPRRIQIMSHSPLRCHGSRDVADLTYYTTRSDSGVLDAGTPGWVDALACDGPARAPTCRPRVVQITRNILIGFAAGPAAKAHPAHPNLRRFSISLKHPVDV